MSQVDQEKLWFNTPDPHTLCRAGGNGPEHPSQLYALKKYWDPETMTLLDYGAGSATTFEAIGKQWPDFPYIPFNYRGLDVIQKNTKWCQKEFPEGDFKFNQTIHRIDEPDKSWDVVYSRHVVDHMNSFEEAMDEHCRVAKKLVIVILWVPFSTGDNHEIKHIVDQGKTYENEYTNQYSEKKVKEWIAQKEQKGWELLELTKDVGAEVKGHDIVIVLKRGGGE